MTLLRKWWDLSAQERLLLAKAGLVVLTVRCGLMLFRYGDVESFVRRVSSQHASDRRAIVDDKKWIEKVVWAIGAVTRRIQTERSCLTRALAAQWILGRGGIDVEVCIGAVRKPVGGMAAHAWVERDGRVILGGPMSPARYQKFVRRSK